MNSKVSQIVTNLATGKTSNANEAFSRIMAEKVNAALDERKVAVAASIYSKPEAK